jgi:hypothetical protein
MRDAALLRDTKEQMETFKQFNEILEADGRQKYFGRTLQDFHKRAEQIALHDAVPENIRNHFLTARHLLIYSWFYYPFHVSAMLQAFVSVEFALKEKAGAPHYRAGFKRLLEMAVQNRWIRDEGFAIVRRRNERIKRQKEELEALGMTWPDETEVRSYCETLLEVLPFFRNDLAHGTTFLDNGSAKWLEACADLINQLFPKPAEGTVARAAKTT